ncbi:LINE-1 retrotransposable element O protein [Sesamum angolense]|uniref:LINE-1 retrotransposable element O protein n=1 Tax=Sesamum angolense TaxID=2727404 RepID=A0AAE1XH72_9LAMI|nr:LINE-1 retrotransposable element O protein [Sesamum angolense]
MAIKVDLSKAYDRVEWPFLLGILDAAGFSETFVRWISQCVSSTSFSLLINGAAFDYFRPSRGIRQGDPLSPYLFIIYAEFLSRLLLHEESLGNLKGVKVCRIAPAISHLFYADDLIIFCRAEEKDAHTVRQCLSKFEEWSSQLANSNKSMVHFSENVTKEQKDDILRILQMPECNHRSKHLGLPFCKPKSRTQVFNELVEKLEGRLSLWKAKNLSRAGKMVKGASWVWQDVKSAKTLELGVCFPASTHSVINIWEDPWIPSIDSFKPQTPVDLNPNWLLLVRDLIDREKNSWKLEVIAEMFPSAIVNEIRKIQIPDPLEPIKPFWAPSKSGKFSAKAVEDAHHLFLNCPFTEKIWLRSKCQVRLMAWSHLSLREWFMEISTPSSKEFPDCETQQEFLTTWAITLEQIWKARNDRMHGKPLHDLESLAKSILSKTTDHFAAQCCRKSKT